MPPSTSSPGRLIKIIFTDIPAGIALEQPIKPTTVKFQDFMTLLYHVSSSVIDSLDGFSQIRLPGHGFTLNDGCWWYRTVTPANGKNEDKVTSDNTVKGAWKELEDPTDYDRLIADMAVGLPEQAIWIEIQHNLQRLRDETVARQAFLAETKWQADFTDHNGPGPAVQTSYVGPMIINGSAYKVLSPAKSASSDLEKFPDLPMPDFAFPFIQNPNLGPLHQFDLVGVAPPPPYAYSNPHQDSQVHANSYQGPRQLNPQFHVPPNDNHQPLQFGPDASQWNQHQYQNYDNRNFKNSYLQNNYHNGNSHCNNFNGNFRNHNGNFRDNSINGNFHTNNNTFNNFNNRGNFRGRGRGGRKIPSFTQRPGPFPRQVGTPLLNSHAHFADRNRHQREEQEIQNKLDTSKHGQSFARLEAKLDAEYHASFQTGSPNSVDRIQGNNPGKRYGARQGHGDENGTTRTTQHNHSGGLGHFGHGPNEVQFSMPSFHQYGVSNAHGDFLGMDPSMHPSMSNQATCINAFNGSRPGDQQHFNISPGSLIHPSMTGGSPTFLPSYSNPGYHNSHHLNENMHFTADFTKEPEINAHIGSDAGYSTNQSSRSPSAASSHVFSVPQSAQNSFLYDRFPQHPPQPYWGRMPTLAATYHTADEFSDNLTGRITHADHNTFGAGADAFFSSESHLPGDGTPRPEKKGNQANHNKISANRRGFQGNDNYTKTGKKQKQQQKDKTGIKFNSLLKIPAPSGPPVGDFSPPKPREQREERAKKTFQNQEKQSNKVGKGSSLLTDQSNPAANSTNKPKSKNKNKDHKKSKGGGSISASGKTNANFGAAASHNRFSNTRTLSTANLKLGEFAASASASASASADESDPTELLCTPGEQLTALRLRTRAENQAKEAAELESSAKKLVVKVKEQNEGRKARAARRASEKFGEEGKIKEEREGDGLGGIV